MRIARVFQERRVLGRRKNKSVFRLLTCKTGSAPQCCHNGVGMKGDTWRWEPWGKPAGACARATSPNWNRSPYRFPETATASGGGKCGRRKKKKGEWKDQMGLSAGGGAPCPRPGEGPGRSESGAQGDNWRAGTARAKIRRSVTSKGKGEEKGADNGGGGGTVRT